MTESIVEEAERACDVSLKNGILRIEFGETMLMVPLKSIQSMLSTKLEIQLSLDKYNSTSSYTLRFKNKNERKVIEDGILRHVVFDRYPK